MAISLKPQHLNRYRQIAWLFIKYGRSDLVKESGLEMHGNAVKVNEKMETNVPGVFAVGDVCTHGGKLKLIATGVGEAAIAANFAKVFIDPTAKAFPGHSTSLFAKKED